MDGVGMEGGKSKGLGKAERELELGGSMGEVDISVISRRLFIDRSCIYMYFLLMRLGFPPFCLYLQQLSLLLLVIVWI